MRNVDSSKKVEYAECGILFIKFKAPSHPLLKSNCAEESKKVAQPWCVLPILIRTLRGLFSFLNSQTVTIVCLWHFTHFYPNSLSAYLIFMSSLHLTIDP